MRVPSADLEKIKHEDLLGVQEVLRFIGLTFPRLSQGTDPEYGCMAWELIGSRDC